MANLYDHTNGRDVTAIGYETCDSAGNLGGTTSMIGRWESITFDVKWDWATNTSSDAGEDQKRPLRRNWTGKASNFMDGGGSVAVAAALNSPYIALYFTEALSGKGLVAKGGIDSASMTVNAESGKDDLAIMSVGIPNSISYA